MGGLSASRLIGTMTIPQRKIAACYEMSRTTSHLGEFFGNILLLVVSYGCETWSVASREEHRLWVFKNSVQRKTFWPKMDEITGGWRNRNNKAFNHILHSLLNIIRNQGG
jgi:hypothetical protein